MKYDKKELDSWAEQSLDILKQQGYIKRDFSLLYILIVLVLGITITGAFIYGGNADWFKDDVLQQVDVDPQINISNNYKFDINDQDTNNYNPSHNFTIINNIDCPTI